MIYEQADQPFEFGTVSPGQFRPNRNICFPRVTVEQGLACGQGGDEHRAALPIAQFVQCIGKFTGQFLRNDVAGAREFNLRRKIARNFQPTVANELGRPVSELIITLLFRSAFALPYHVIRVLNTEAGQRRPPSLTEGAIELLKFPQNDADGPAVGDQKMKGEQ